MDNRGKRARLVWIVWFVCILSIALFLRMHQLPTFLDPETFEFQGVDSYYRWRRVELLNHYFPHLPSFDLYSGFPRGGNCPWSPGMEFLAVGTAKLLGFSENHFRLQQIASLLPVFFGLLTILLCLILVRKLADSSAILLCSLILALMPAHISVSRLGLFDNQAVEPLLVAAMLVLVCLVGPRQSDSGGEKLLLGDIITSFIAGLVFGTVFLFWRGSLILFLMVAMHFCLALVLMPEFRSSLARKGMLFFGGSTLIVTPYCASFIWFEQAEFYFDKPSLFQPALLFTLFLLFFIIVLGLKIVKKYHLSTRSRIVLFLLGIMVIIIAVLSGMGSTFIDLWGFIGETDPWRATASEYWPLLLTPVGCDFNTAPFLLTKLIFLVPLVLIWFVHYLVRKKNDPMVLWQSLFVLLCFVLTLGFTLAARRFVSLVIVPWVIILSLALSHFHHKIYRKSKLIIVIVLALILGYALPTRELVSSRNISSLASYAPIPGFVTDGIKWIKRNTPETSFYLEPDQKADYGMLPNWAHGNWLMVMGQRPVMTNNFGTEIPGLHESLAVLMSTTEENALSILEDWRIRYIWSIPEITNIADYCWILGKINEFIQIDIPAAGPSTGRVFNPRPLFYYLLTVRLHLYDGSAFITPYGDTITGLEHFRLLYEHPTYLSFGHSHVSLLKIFERVAGCTVEGKTLTDTIAVISATITLNSGRTFKYRCEQNVSEIGTYVFVLPYPTSYLIEISDRNKKLVDQKMFTLSENDILTGKRIQLEFTQATW